MKWRKFEIRTKSEQNNGKESCLIFGIFLYSSLGEQFRVPGSNPQPPRVPQERNPRFEVGVGYDTQRVDDPPTSPTLRLHDGEQRQPAERLVVATLRHPDVLVQRDGCVCHVVPQDIRTTSHAVETKRTVQQQSVQFICDHGFHSAPAHGCSSHTSSAHLVLF